MIFKQETYRSERLILRPVEKSDMGLLELYRGDERIARGTKHIPHPLPPGATEAFVKTAHSETRNADVWIIDASPCGRPAVSGAILLDRLDRKQSEITYWVAPDMWRTGLASEAVGTIVSANPHDACAIFAEVFQDNPVSARILTNTGFQWLGDAETFSVARNSLVPTWTYAYKPG